MCKIVLGHRSWQSTADNAVSYHSIAVVEAPRLRYRIEGSQAVSGLVSSVVPYADLAGVGLASGVEVRVEPHAALGDLVSVYRAHRHNRWIIYPGLFRVVVRTMTKRTCCARTSQSCRSSGLVGGERRGQRPQGQGPDRRTPPRGPELQDGNRTCSAARRMALPPGSRHPEVGT